MTTPYRILERKRAGERLSVEEVRAVVKGAADGSWADAQLGAFLMAAAIRGLGPQETRVLTQAMLESGDLWELRGEIADLGDKHSTGGVGDKVSLVLSPILAACDRPVAMLTGRGLGHTGGTTDKLESIPGLDLALDRSSCLRTVRETGMAIGMATTDVAPADRKLYSLRDVTATIDSLPLITASILSKKLATGAAGVAFDIKTGSGAFIPEPARAHELASMLVRTAEALGTPTTALVTDMSQPLGRWVGHAVEVQETLECLEGNGPADLMEITYALCREVGVLVGKPFAEGELEAAVASGRAREVFARWAAVQGAEAGWEQRLRDGALAPVEVVLTAPSEGYLAAIDTKEVGLLLAEAGGGRQHPSDTIDHQVSLHMKARLGDELVAGQELARLYLRRPNDDIAARLLGCFHQSEASVEPPPLIRSA